MCPVTGAFIYVPQLTFKRQETMRIGYARVSTQDQNLDRQRDQLRQDGCERIYEEKESGARSDRPELGRLLDALREGDVIVVAELSRLSRSVRDLFSIVGQVHEAGAEIKSLKERPRRGGSSSPSSAVSASSSGSSSVSAPSRESPLHGPVDGLEVIRCWTRRR